MVVCSTLWPAVACVRGLLGPVAAFDDRRVPICLSLSVSATVRVHRLWFVNAGSEKMSCAERSIGLSEVMSGFSFWLCTRLVGKLERSCIFISCAGFKGLRLGCERCLRFLRCAREDTLRQQLWISRMNNKSFALAKPQPGR